MYVEILLYKDILLYTACILGYMSKCTYKLNTPKYIVISCF